MKLILQQDGGEQVSLGEVTKLRVQACKTHKHISIGGPELCAHLIVGGDFDFFELGEIFPELLRDLGYAVGNA
jgi:hypothetical protein